MCFLCQSLDPTITEYDPHVISAGTTVTEDPLANPGNLPTYTLDQVAYQLTNGYWESENREWRAFDVQAGGTLYVNIDGLDALGQEAALTALAAWTAVSGLQFEQTSGSADITFDDDNAGAYNSSSVYVGMNQIASSFINVETDWRQYGDYYTQTFIHEIGHALGLGHGGNYNGWAVFEDDAHYTNDSWQMTVMSYFSQWENPNVDATYNLVATPMMADILAIQNLYGTPVNVNTGNTVYGDNTTLTQLGMDLTNSWAVTIFDSAGTDLVDLGSRSHNQRLDLRAEHFSDLNGEIGNFGIARGAEIENALTGSGDDEVTGNAAANDIRTGAGNDTIFGGEGNDTLDAGSGDDLAIIKGRPDDYDFGWDGAALILTDIKPADETDEGTDRLTGFEALSFTDGYAGVFETDGVTTTLRINADGSALTHRLLTMDTADAYDWSTIARTFDAGKWATQINTYDNGRVLEIGFVEGQRSTATMTDTGDVYAWECYTDSFDTTGARISNEMIWDTGKVVETFYSDGVRSSSLVTDGGDEYAWHSIERVYDTGGALSLLTNTYDDGRVQQIVYTDGAKSSITTTDSGDIAAWTSYVDTFDTTSGALLSRNMVYDDGREVANTYSNGKVVENTITDGGDAFIWASITRTWDSAGKLDSQAIAYDNGLLYEIDFNNELRSGAVLTDTQDSYAWESAVETYDSSGALTERITTWDDGSQTVMSF